MVKDMVKEKRMLIKKIRERQKNWIGHVMRSDSLNYASGMGKKYGSKEGYRNEVTG